MFFSNGFRAPETRLCPPPTERRLGECAYVVLMRTHLSTLAGGGRDGFRNGPTTVEGDSDEGGDFRLKMYHHETILKIVTAQGKQYYTYLTV